MTDADGRVLPGATKVVDNGPAALRWNLVILGDGYREGELGQYEDDVRHVHETMRAEQPFRDLWAAVNVYRVDVVSAESGADDPIACGGSDTQARTFFDATFCADGRVRRLLDVDSPRAMAAAFAAVPQVHQILVIVNTPEYGGSGGQVATCSTHTQAAQLAIHEIGHSAFGLADEYEEYGSAVGGGEPCEPNVTLDAHRATNKWRDLIDDETPMPSACYPQPAECTSGSDCVPPGTPPAPGAVGAYEGARRIKCGVYRPAPRCKMRSWFPGADPFCPVCQRVIRRVLQPFHPDESIVDPPPTIRFTDIPEGVGGVGVTTYRAITFEVVTHVRTLTFGITDGPTGGFGTPEGRTSDPAGPGRDRAHIWLSYTSTAAGDRASGTVTVQCNETMQRWTIDIVANTVPRPRSAVALVLDRSGSMAQDAGEGTAKVDKLREAARIFVEAMAPGDGISLVRFDHRVRRLMEVTDVGEPMTGAGRRVAKGWIDGSELDPAGATSIGGGVEVGWRALMDPERGPSFEKKAMVVLTDGVENYPPMLWSVRNYIADVNVYAIGLGLPSNISTLALTTLTQERGYLVVTGALTPSESNRLTKYFLQALAGIRNCAVLLDPGGVLTPGAVHRIPFFVSEADYGLDVYLLTSDPEAVRYVLETPDGTIVEPGDLQAAGVGQYVTGDGVAYYRTGLPVPPGAHHGTWHALLGLDPPDDWFVTTRRSPYRFDNRQQTVAYDLVVHAHSGLTFDGQVVQHGNEPGDTVGIYAVLREYGVPVARGTAVWADVVRPNGSEFSVALTESGNQHQAEFATTVPGLYQLRLRARGETLAGMPFTRETTLTAAAVPRDGGQAASDQVLHTLCAALRSVDATGELWKRLDALGVDVDALRRHLADACPGHREGEPFPRDPTPPDGPQGCLHLIIRFLSWLRRLMRI